MVLLPCSKCCGPCWRCYKSCGSLFVTDDFCGQGITVKHFPKTSLGLYDMAGNIWEWTDSEYREENNELMKTIKGGSFLCEPDFCHGYRVSSRMGTTPETSLMHTGFRTVKN